MVKDRRTDIQNYGNSVEISIVILLIIDPH